MKKTTHERGARWRQRRRHGLVALVAILVAAALAVGISLARDGGGSSVGARPHTSMPPSVRTRFVVFVSSYARPRWSGLVLVDPGHRRCTNVPLLGSPSYVTFSGDRYVYSTGPRSYRLGRIGGPPPRRFVTETDELPYWLGGKVGLAGEFSRQLRLGGRTISFDLPPGAQVDDFAASRGRIAFQAWWGNFRDGTGRSAIFLIAHGVQRKVASAPPFATLSTPSPTDYNLLDWTPDGRRLLFETQGDLWTMSPDGTHKRRLRHFARPVYDGGTPLWSPDGRYVAFVGGNHRPPETYVVRADGSRPVRRLTRSEWSSGPYGQQNGTVPLAWLSPNALAAAHQFSIGILGLDGSFRAICTRQGVTFSNGATLPRRSRAARQS